MRGNFTHLYVHCVWATWDRQPLLIASVEASIYAAIKAKALALGAEVQAIGGDVDHVHLLATIPPTLCVSHLVKEVKGASSHLMNHRIAPEKTFRWQGSYGAFTVSPHSLDKVRRYIENQKQHHSERRTFTDWERCFDE